MATTIIHMNRKGTPRIPLRMDVPDSFLAEIDTHLDQHKITRLDGSETALSELKGDIVLDVNKITIAELCWLDKRRNVIYMLPSADNKLINIGID